MVFTHFIHIVCICWGFPGGAVVNNPPANAGDARDASSTPGLRRSSGGNPLQYPYLEKEPGGLWSRMSQSQT